MLCFGSFSHRIDLGWAPPLYSEGSIFEVMDTNVFMCPCVCVELELGAFEKQGSKVYSRIYLEVLAVYDAALVVLMLFVVCDSSNDVSSFTVMYCVHIKIFMVN